MLQQSAATIPSSRLWVVVGVILCWFSLIVVGNEVPYEEYVDILGGTDSRYDISFGNTLPLVTRPWGFNSYAPQTDNDPTYPGFLEFFFFFFFFFFFLNFISPLQTIPLHQVGGSIPQTSDFLASE